MYTVAQVASMCNINTVAVYKNIKKNRGRKEKFTEQDKNAMLMHKITGKSYREIADIYGCGVGTVFNIIKKIDVK